MLAWSTTLKITFRQMLVTVNGQERTIRQFSDILEIAGWEIEEVKSAAATQAHIIAIPAVVQPLSIALSTRL